MKAKKILIIIAVIRTIAMKRKIKRKKIISIYIPQFQKRNKNSKNKNPNKSRKNPKLIQSLHQLIIQFKFLLNQLNIFKPITISSILIRLISQFSLLYSIPITFNTIYPLIPRYKKTVSSLNFYPKKLSHLTIQ